jgi:septum formation topological specificity factor MinE
MIKVEVNTNNWVGLDQSADSTGNSLEARPTKPKPRSSPFRDFQPWGSRQPTKAPKDDPAAPMPKVTPKPIDARSALGAAFKKASDAMIAYVKALESIPQNPNDIADKESKAAAAKSELSAAIANKADSMCRLKQVDTFEHAILDVVRKHVEAGKVDPANEVLFREAAKQALNHVRTSPAPQK